MSRPRISEEEYAQNYRRRDNSALKKHCKGCNREILYNQYYSTQHRDCRLSVNKPAPRDYDKELVLDGVWARRFSED